MKIDRFEDGYLYVHEFYHSCPGDEECFAEGGCGAVFSEEEVLEALTRM